MVVVPPVNARGAHEPYHISVNLNCFTPTSHITTIKRRTWDGEFVGDFEYTVPFDDLTPFLIARRIGPAGAKTPNSVCLRNNEYPLGDVLTSSMRLFRDVRDIDGAFMLS